MISRWPIVAVLILNLGLAACQPVQAEAALQNAAVVPAETAEEQANQAVVQRLYDEVFTGKDMEVLAEVFVPNLVVHDLDVGGEYPGGGLRDTLRAFPDVVATVNQLVVEGDMVAAYVTYNATHQSEFLGVAPTGKAVTWSIIDLFRVQDGKITDIWHNIPNDDILEQIATPDEQSVAPGMGGAPIAERQHAMVEDGTAAAVSGSLDSMSWEPGSELEVRQNGNVAFVRYESFSGIVAGGEVEPVNAWHTDMYEKQDGRWQFVCQLPNNTAD